MSTMQAHVQTSIRRAEVDKPKTKSAGALRMQRLRRQRKHLDVVAEKLRNEFFNEMFRMLADETPKGSTQHAARMISEAWLKAGRVPPKTRKYLTG